MGAALSAVFNGSAIPTTTPEKPQVKQFHSPAEWQLHFDKVKDSHKLLVIFFTAKWSGTCKLIEPVIHELANRYSKAEFIKLDVDELSDVEKEFEVKGRPTFVLWKEGKEITRFLGARKEKELEDKIRELCGG